jgi:hypothetical protein
MLIFQGFRRADASLGPCCNPPLPCRPVPIPVPIAAFGEHWPLNGMELSGGSSDETVIRIANQNHCTGITLTNAWRGQPRGPGASFAGGLR